MNATLTVKDDDGYEGVVTAMRAFGAGHVMVWTETRMYGSVAGDLPLYLQGFLVKMPSKGFNLG